MKIVSSNYILWLGDIGSGAAGLGALQEKSYEAVRMNRSFVNLFP